MGSVKVNMYYTIERVDAASLVDADDNPLSGEVPVGDDAEGFEFTAVGSGVPVGVNLFRNGDRCSALLIEGDPVEVAVDDAVTVSINQESGVVSASV